MTPRSGSTCINSSSSSTSRTVGPWLAACVAPQRGVQRGQPPPQPLIIRARSPQERRQRNSSSLCLTAGTSSWHALDHSDKEADGFSDLGPFSTAPQSQLSASRRFGAVVPPPRQHNGQAGILPSGPTSLASPAAKREEHHSDQAQADGLGDSVAAPAIGDLLELEDAADVAEGGRPSPRQVTVPVPITKHKV